MTDRYSIARRYYKEVLVKELSRQDNAEAVAEAIHDLITAELDAAKVEWLKSAGVVVKP